MKEQQYSDDATFVLGGPCRAKWGRRFLPLYPLDEQRADDDATGDAKADTKADTTADAADAV
eukprot:CAMPEP_0194337562 /NCGR_PEP_ID=MMETSP0171-20130528/76699_1 /TAXON_ID=218684 /ORGANISM="Corethron pennatum, Strain L29A3" /LENGTH=61 /DNA_ID=CAMNT_0039101385 /DNA_START=9 /DNA_END=191 /DNA_ORIENTATION=+